MAHQRGKVLIVDDDLLSIETLSVLLSADYSISVARNGLEALESANASEPDVILLDIVMPEMDGYEVIRQLQANPKLCDIPVLFITVMSEAESEIIGLSLGAHDYLTKPYNPKIVRLRVKNHVNFKRNNDLVKQQRDLLKQKNEELENTLSRLRKLEGIITICMYCKNIRNEMNSWEQLEKYVSANSDALFSHGVCPECFKRINLQSIEAIDQ
ncbi:response regulator PleD [Geobacter sp. OR-1]|uniref:response regulator n=1 Tax=Geobacter sp. OR-1 TaxID=1266765 RepID=UPI000541ED6D|nr:response regulator [Geobacter sp. OR-1]GAM09141.1 response regulator PleD [Geobacter sp. OR-1]